MMSSNTFNYLRPSIEFSVTIVTENARSGPEYSDMSVWRMEMSKLTGEAALSEVWTGRKPLPPD